MALVLAPVLPQLLGDHQVVLGMHVLKRPLVVSRSGHSLYSILLAFHNQRSSVKKGLYCKHKAFVLWLFVESWDLLAKCGTQDGILVSLKFWNQHMR